MVERPAPHIAPPEVTYSLRLTNHNEFTITDMFDGVPFEFPPGRAVTIPADAAHHMLGWFAGADPAAVKTHVQKRWGWNTPTMVESGNHDKFFGNLEFKPVGFRMIEVPMEEIDDAGEAIPAVPLRGAAARSHAAKADKQKGADATA